MGEVDTIFSISRGTAMYYLSSLNGDIPSSAFVRPGIRKKGKISLESVLQESKDVCANPRSIGRLKKYKDYQALFSDKVGELKERIPIMMTGVSVPEEEGFEKLGYDPFSNSFLATTKMLALPEHVPLEFLKEKFVFWPISPIDFPFVFDEIEGESGIKHVFKEDVLAMPKTGVGFGTLEKFDIGPKIGNYKFNESLFDANILAKRIAHNPEGFMKNEQIEQTRSLEELLDYFRTRVIFSKELLAMKYAKFFEQLNVSELCAKHSLLGLPLFAEKGSYATDVCERAKKYNKNISIHHIGGKGGPMQNLDVVTRNGIAHDTAMNRLFGFVSNVYEHETGKKASKPPRRKQEEKFSLDLHQDPDYPFFLCEIPDCSNQITARELLKTLSEKELEYVQHFSRERWVGFSRIEARVVELLKSNPSIYLGRRSQSKINLKWQEELRGKKVVFPEVTDSSGEFDLRGSELTHRNNDIERILAKVPRETRANILKEHLSANPKEQPEFYRNYDGESLESKAAIKGTAIHKIIGAPFPGLKHYETLSLAGIPATPSSVYCERAFLYDHNGIKISFHPDAFFLLEGEHGKDILLMDHKTNRKLEYPQWGYIDQTLAYAYMINKMLNINAKNFYLCIDYMAFDNAVSGAPRIPGSEGVYRKQQFSITKVPTNHPLIQYIEDEFTRTHENQQKLLHDNKYFREYLAEHHLKWKDAQIVMNNLLDRMGTNRSLSSVLYGIK